MYDELDINKTEENILWEWFSDDTCDDWLAAYTLGLNKEILSVPVLINAISLDYSWMKDAKINPTSVVIFYVLGNIADLRNVALGRCTTMKGITLSARLLEKDVKVDPRIVDYMKETNKNKSLFSDDGSEIIKDTMIESEILNQDYVSNNNSNHNSNIAESNINNKSIKTILT